MSQPNLIQTLPLHGRRLIEASAGTGKTFTLAGLYLRLVLGVNCEARMPPDILVLTFTRAATRELRDRIRSRLVDAAQAFRDGHSPDDNLQWLINHFPEQRLPACARLLDVAAGWMDEAAIHTIHAWCQTMLRQHAFDSGSLFDQAVDAADPLLAQHAVADYWRQWWYTDHPYRHHLGQWVSGFDDFASQIHTLRRSAASLVAAGQPIKPLSPGDFLDQLRALEQGPGQAVAEVLQAWTTQDESVETCLLLALEQGFYADSRSGIPAAKATVRQLIHEIPAWQPGQPFPDGLDTLLPSHLETLCKKNKAPSHPWLDQLEAAWQAMGGYPDCTARLWQHAVNSINALLKQEKQRANAMDFDDLLSQLDEALAGPGGDALRQTLLNQFPIALVDEFQDTDPVQFRIFRRVWGDIAADDGHKGLFLIGDPKQSIYSFRGADIHAYLEARDNTDSRHTLGRNFRSTEGMVQAVNALFEAGDQHPQGAFAFARPDAPAALPFEPVDAQGRKEALLINEAPVTPLTLWYHPEDDDSQNLGLGRYREIMAEQAAETIVRLLAMAEQGKAVFRTEDKPDKPLCPADIAVLVRQRSQAELVMRALRRRGVAAVYLSDKESIFDSEQARELCLVLKGIAEPGDERSVRTALATRLFGHSPAELDALNQDEQQIEAAFDRFADLLALWRHKGVLAMIQRLLDLYQLPARMLADADQGERALTNLLHLAELLQTESQGLDGEQALIQWLNEQVQQNQRGQSDEQQLRLESDAELVRVVTCHAAKGLEYPLVMAPFVCDYREGKNDGPLSYHDGHRPVLDLEPDETAVAHHQLETLQEELRLFYVAVTRARHACWLGTAPVRSGNAKKQPPALARYPFGHLLLGLADDPNSPPSMSELLDGLIARAGALMARIDLDGHTPTSRLASQSADTLGPARHYQGHAREAWWIASYSALKQVGGEAARSAFDDAPDAADNAAEDQAREESGDQNDTAENNASQGAGWRQGQGIHGFPAGPRPGTFLHGLLEWAGRQGLAETAAEPQAFLAEIDKRCRLRGWGRWSKTVQDWMLDQLRQPMALGEQRLSLAELALGHYTPELEFWFQASRVDTVALDRLVRRATFGRADRKPLARNQLNGMMRGFIDLVFEHQGRYYVLDYKSNKLGDSAQAYTPEAMQASVLDKRYDLQFSVYTLALHRLLKSRLPDYDYDRHVGGSVYLYLRGCGAPGGGVFHYQPARELIEVLDALFTGQEASHAA
ncbi:MAG: exodeoxyribonuclease V subunit beta [Wenzhouxiangella sp.]